MADIEVTASGLVVADVGLPTSVVVDPDSMTVSGGTDGGDPGYPDIIIDQRFGYGGTSSLESIQAVQAFWEKRAEAELTLEPTEVVPYINASRWVADCLCGLGMLAWDRNPYVACLSCGRKYSVVWQLPALRSAVIRELACRPVKHRNWDPRRLGSDGEMLETPEFLRRENVLMGLV